MNANKSGIIIGSAARTTVDATSSAAKHVALSTKSFFNGLVAGYSGLNTVQSPSDTQVALRK